MGDPFDHLARAVMALRPDLPATSLDEWLLTYWHRLTLPERAVAEAALAVHPDHIPEG